MARFVIRLRKDGEYQFDLKATNGQVILTSEGYKAKSACINGIESVRKNSSEDGRYDRSRTSNGKFHFNLKANNGQVIGSSQTYESMSGMNNGVESVKKNGKTLNIEDLTA